MRINADFESIVVVTPDQHCWVNSPQGGVSRVMLDRIGAEKARATSLVRYAPGSSFPAHRHPGGEEILVLDGTFSDEQGHCPEGWYLRNPPGSKHSPASADGCIIFVKLWQMEADEEAPVRMEAFSASEWAGTGRSKRVLFEGPQEKVTVLQVGPRLSLFEEPLRAAELLVLAGSLQISGGGDQLTVAKGAWIRAGGADAPDFLAGLVSGSDGATVYVKQGLVVACPSVAKELL